MVRRLGGWISFSCLVGLVACSSEPELFLGEDGGTDSADDDSMGGQDSSLGGGIALPGSGGKSGSGGSISDDCGGEACSLGQRCDTAGGKETCVDSECEDLDCAGDEECAPAPGGGYYCKSIACEDDDECPLSRFCDDGVCKDDVCEPGTQTCQSGTVAICSLSGGEEEEAFSCGSAGYFTSACVDADEASSTCSCEDDWDCPEFTVCEAGSCLGRGSEPTCSLPPQSFEDLLPELEFRWGGTSSGAPNTYATGKAFEYSSQVGSTPIVANLNDDNGDGVINELDFPEIVFLSYLTEDDDPQINGVVRAVHGGGPTKGQDYFALCGSSHWLEGEPITQDCTPGTGGAEDRTAALGRASGALAVGDLDGDNYPEIVVPLEGGDLQILDNQGKIIDTLGQDLRFDGRNWYYPAPAIANLDHAGLAEIVVGNRVVTLKKTGTVIEFDRVFSGDLADGTMHHSGEQGHHGPVVCVADLSAAHAGLEFVAGTTAYRLPVAPANCDPPNDTSAYCQGDLEVLWDAGDANEMGDIPYENGFCAIADVWGANLTTAPSPSNPLDQKPEVVVMADGVFLILRGDTGELISSIDLNGGEQGGAPNIDDFDGDGFPELASALADFYAVVDLQETSAACPAWPDLLSAAGAPPGTNPARTPSGTCVDDDDCAQAGTTCNENIGQCVCLHNGWKRDTEDDSSKVTSSSVFDFNGDGAAEVVYNDECYFRIYDGTNGGVYFATPSLSRTIIENPVVADVDNDGNAEIVFIQNNEQIRCSEAALDSWPDGNNDVDRTTLPNGIEVWGDPGDRWVAARRIWNQHSYHVTNVLESGGIPIHEPESWKDLNGRLYNTYRSQPRAYGVAPNLVVGKVQVTSPGVACGELSDEILVSVQIRNDGDLRVGPGVQVAFEGLWQNPAESEALEDAMGDPIVWVLDKSLEPGASTVISVSYEAGNNGREDLPNQISVTVDSENAEQECDEDNVGSGLVDAGDELADLLVEIENTPACASPSVAFSVSNEGAAIAQNFVVRIYAGDPSSGGKVLGETTVTEPVSAGGSFSGMLSLSSIALDVTLYAVVDPTGAVDECNDGNNTSEGPTLNCNVVK